MRNGNLLFSAVQFLMIAALFGIGAVFFGLHFLHGARLEFANWILQNSDRYLVLGYLLFGTSCVLTLCLWSMQRKKFLRVQLEKGKFSIEESVIRARIDAFWEEAFPGKPKPTDVYIAHQKIEVIADNSLEDLEQIEERLSTLLANEFGYNKPTFVTTKSL